MIIRNYFYDEYLKNLYVEFSTKEDGDDYYRILELEYNDIMLYIPDAIDDEDLISLRKKNVVEIIMQYLLDNELPEKECL